MLPIFKDTSVINKNLTEYVCISVESNNTNSDSKILSYFLDISLFNEISKNFNFSINSKN